MTKKPKNVQLRDKFTLLGTQDTGLRQRRHKYNTATTKMNILHLEKPPHAIFRRRFLCFDSNCSVIVFNENICLPLPKQEL